VSRHSGAGSTPREVTLEEWADWDEDEPGEVVDGVVVAEEMPGFAHELIVTWLAATFRSWPAERPPLVGGSEAKFGVLPRTGRKPDLSVYLPGSPKPPAEGLIRTPPDIMVEILSPGAKKVRRDRLDKMSDYAAFGVKWYWLVDPRGRSLEIYERRAAATYERVVASSARIDAVPGCPGLVLDLPALWRELDALES
jgi:Uma2 family endonuclease